MAEAVSNPRSCLITGGAGFIGSHLADALVQQGHQVTVLDNLSTGKLENLRQSVGDIRWVEGDIRDLTLLKKLTRSVDVIFHHAALASVNQSFVEPQLTMDINVNGALNVLEAARRNSVDRVIFVSSAAVYDARTAEAKSETSPKRLQSPYAYSKWLGEEYCQMYSQLYNVKTLCLRYFNAFGSRQNADSQYSGVISAFMNAVLQGKTPTVYGDGLQTRDFVHVSNIVQANLLAMDSGATGVFNVGTGSNHSLLKILDFLSDKTQLPFEIRFAEQRRNDPRHSLANIDKIQKELGFEPITSFTEGLDEVYAWFQQTLSSPTLGAASFRKPS